MAAQPATKAETADDGASEATTEAAEGVGDEGFVVPKVEDHPRTLPSKSNSMYPKNQPNEGRDIIPTDVTWRIIPLSK